MSDPQRLDDAHPRRAEPLQPDNPASGRAPQSNDDSREAADRKDSDRAREQENTAVENARQDYR